MGRPNTGTEVGEIDVGAALVAGVAAGLAYAAVQEADIRLTGRNVDDIAVLGRLVVARRGPVRPIGLALHLVNSVALALVYAAVESRLPGPAPVRGMVFATVENCVLYPVTVFEQKHPGIREGSIASYRSWPAFTQSIPRHLAYGAVLGFLFRRLRRR